MKFGRTFFAVLIVGSLVLSVKTYLANGSIVSSNERISNYRGVHAISYHVGNDEDVDNALSQTQYGKPIIVSDDGAHQDRHATKAEVKRWLGKVLAASKNGDSYGRFHYEHLDGPLKERGESHLPIGGISTFPAASHDTLDAIEHFIHENHLEEYVGFRSPPVITARNGKLFGGRYGTEPAILIGYGWYGPMVSNTTDCEAYLSVLNDHYVNFLRVFVIDMWDVATEGDPYAADRGVVPWTGELRTHDYDLDPLRTYQETEFISRLRYFVQTAKNLGFVVQLVLFDRWTLCNKSGDNFGMWNESPYNKVNNKQSFLDVPTAFTQTSDDSLVAAVNKDLVARCVRAVSEYGNVVFEIMNEPVACGGELPNTSAWHRWAADRINENLNP